MTNFINKQMEENDYPYLYQIADSVSNKYQKRHYYLMRLYLLLLIIGSILSILPYILCIKIAAIVIFLISLIIFIVHKTTDPLSVWYNGRSVAESIKAVTWRWMMSTTPYDVSNNDLFLDNVRAIYFKNEKISTASSIISDNNLNVYSEKMKWVKGLSIPDKLNYYNMYRVDDQLKWYNSKSKFNQKRYKLFFNLTVISYFIIIILMILDAISEFKYLPIGIFSTIAAAFISWIEAKKYNELANAYRFTVSDIRWLKEASNENINTQDELSDYILDCEAAFSREHVDWLARKK